jgi:hypothetical protein
VKVKLFAPGFIDGGKLPMKMLAYILAIACVALAAMYFVMPGGALPTFFPGYDPGSTHVHRMHGVAAVTVAVIFLLFGLTRRR